MLFLFCSFPFKCKGGFKKLIGYNYPLYNKFNILTFFTRFRLQRKDCLRSTNRQKHKTIS